MHLHSRLRLLAGVVLLAVLAAAPQIDCQAPAASAPASHAPEAWVMVHGRQVFAVEGVLSFPAQARADAIGQRIAGVAADVNFKPDSIAVADSASSSNIMAGGLILMSVTDQDARAAGATRQALARDHAKKIIATLDALRHESSLKSILLGLLYAVLATIALIVLLRLLGMLFRAVYRALDSWRGTVIPSLRIQKFELIPADRIADFLIGLVRLARLAVWLIVFYIYASLVLGFFPWTRGYASVLLGYVLSPLKIVGSAALAYLPNIFFIAIIVLVSFYVIKFVRIIFAEIGKGTIALPQFYPEWAAPTYKIVRLLILALAAIAVFPYLPGSKSPAFQGISIFLGLLLSLGSTSAVANVVAGVILTYMRAFTVGDIVKIADTMGCVIEKTLLVTRIRTIKNVEITIANAMVMNSHIVNFSSSASEHRLILHTAVTIGYDAPWRTVHQLLLNAASECENLMKDPRPFVLQTALDDFYVHYEINAFTDRPDLMADTYSVLHQKIQDKFNEGGVEIMSSHYSNVRDGNRTTTPDAYLPRDYVAPSFRLGMEGIRGATGAPAKPGTD
ncbi:MAG TPA: mechanosensitive ion channel domain-containing protein [Terracidiphilus sp.]|nr:mechanosensitive ion channel domain-containing protein [Terracidiphilus sp.]